MVAGIDEVGRGPLAGPVVACAVVMPPDERAIAGVDDSKRLTAPERERLAVIIRRKAVALGLGACSAREIDRINIYQATIRAMQRALARLGISPDHVVVDGRRIEMLGCVHTAVIGGDGRCYTIACASIVAKVTRDRVMRLLARRHPFYAWEENVGYSTPEHIGLLGAHGLSAHHRRSFAPVRARAAECQGSAVLETSGETAGSARPAPMPVLVAMEAPNAPSAMP